MDLKYDERYDAFRHEIRSFLEEHGSSRPRGNNVHGDRDEIARWLSLQIEIDDRTSGCIR